MKAIQRFEMFWHILRNMGLRYAFFKVWYEFQRKTGILKCRFPKVSTQKSLVTIAGWRNLPIHFFFEPGNIQVCKNPRLTGLERRVMQIHQHRYRYFSDRWFEVRDWHTNPLTGYVYDRNMHWSDIQDFSKEAGDIKFVWEKSRFTFLYDLVRYDFHFGQDQSELVFALILNWIEANPVNCGPNWECSQEIALRVFNWTFALHYYRRSDALTQNMLDVILASIHDQMKHVAGNIRFSRVAVRNNHALTETLGLFLTGLLFPFFSESKAWKKCGKRWFEKEINFQIATDGTFIQSSMNYHRVAVQLLAWGIRLAELNGEPLNKRIYHAAKRSLNFLLACQDSRSGELPNYGPNDGALFFPLTECRFNDFRPQLSALGAVLKIDCRFGTGRWSEESEWISGNDNVLSANLLDPAVPAVLTFQAGGYYIIREAGSVTLLRCGIGHGRPFQADQNHLDIWVNGQNILHDAGTWLYNAGEETSDYFTSTAAHNTVMVGDFDQMKRRERFMWTHWTKNAKGIVGRGEDDFLTETVFEGYRHLRKGIIHRRRLRKKRGVLHWIIEDWVEGVPGGIPIVQMWHPGHGFLENYMIRAHDAKRRNVAPVFSGGWFSKIYGKREKTTTISFPISNGYIGTEIYTTKK